MTSKETFRELLTLIMMYESAKPTVVKDAKVIAKDLTVLEEIRKYFKVFDYGEEYQNRYALQAGDVIYPINKETYDRWNKWLKQKDLE